jgi:hypothetical protein
MTSLESLHAAVREDWLGLRQEEILGFCQVSRHRSWLTRAGVAIWPALTAEDGWGCGA